MSNNKYRKLVAKGRGEWIKKWFGGSTETDPVIDGNTVPYEELIVGFRRFSTDQEIFFNKPFGEDR